MTPTGARVETISGIEARTGLDGLVTRLKALGNPTRLGIVELIRRRGEATCVCELEGHFEVSQPTLSHHLKVLREAGLIKSRREGVRSLHRVVPEAFAELREWIGRHAAEKQDVGM